MKILHILYESKGDYFGFGGVAVRAYEIYRRLKCRHEITLLCKRYPGAYDRDIEGLKHVFVGNENNNFTSSLLSYGCEASKFARKYGANYDVIIEEFSPAIPTFLCFYKKRPVVLQIQGFTGRRYFEKYFFLKALTLWFLEKKLPNFYKNIMSVSESTVSSYKLKKKTPVRIISNGIDPWLLNVPAGNENYILYLGRIDVHHKGIDLLFEAFKNLCREFNDIQLVVAGDFRNKAEAYDIISKMPDDVKKRIKMIGWIEGDEKYTLLRDALMVVMPSRYETQGIVALESMACAKPVVVSDIEELRYVVECGAGISFQSENAQSLCEAMRRMMLSNERRQMGEKGRKWVESFTWDKIAVEFEKYLLNAADKK